MKQPILIALVRRWQRSGLRGGTRAAMLLGRLLPGLRSVPVQTASGTIVVDLRVASSHPLLDGRSNEPEIQWFMRQVVRPGDVTLDIGAHFGVHTVLLAELVGRAGQVHAFEPNPRVLPALRQTVAWLPNAALHELALSDAARSAPLFVPGDASMASLADWTDERGRTSTFRCQTVCLDEFLRERAIPPPDFIKCDVEGAELSVFMGAEALLNREDAPLLLFEINDRACRAFGHGADDVVEYLARLPLPRFSFLAIVGTQSIVPLSRPAVRLQNVLAIPARRASQLPPWALDQMPRCELSACTHDASTSAGNAPR